MISLNKKKSAMANCVIYVVLFVILVLCQRESTKYFRVTITIISSEDETVTRTKANRTTHLFENQCKYVWIEDEEPSIKSHIRHERNRSCPRTTVTLFDRLDDGSFSWRDLDGRNVNCTVQELGGALRPATTKIVWGRVEEIPQKWKIFRVNADCFYINCTESTAKTILFSRQYMGLRDSKQLELLLEGPEPTINPSPFDLSSLSISMLALDSTSRAQFSRHMTKSKQVMKDLGFVVLQAYNKVGDNSAINLLPILADQINEGLSSPYLDSTNDINIARTLPFNGSIDPDTIPFLWKRMKELGCETMFNDDIMNLGRGLFHYPPEHFLRGFADKPVDHYYRPYYVNLYKELSNKWKLCLDGRLLAEDFLDAWFRFARNRADKCHFGFSFITSITHDDPNFIELLDDALSDRLLKLNASRTLENTVLIIMGDHGNRVHASRMSFAGKIEERQPMMAIYLPPGLREQYRGAYETLQNNARRLTNNFDIHETLLDLIEKSVVGSKRPSSRGLSLFHPIPTNRTCLDNNVPHNFCLCMDRTSESDRLEINDTEIVNVLTARLKPLNCLRLETLQCVLQIEQFAPNPMVRAAMRNKINWEERTSRVRQSPFTYGYQDCIASTISGSSVEFKVQYRLKPGGVDYAIIVDPMVSSGSNHNCSQEKTLSTFCKCL